MPRIKDTCIEVTEADGGYYVTSPGTPETKFFKTRGELAIYAAAYKDAMVAMAIQPGILEVAYTAKVAVDAMSAALDRCSLIPSMPIPMTKEPWVGLKRGDHILVEAIVERVNENITEWPVKVLVDKGNSRSIDISRNVHRSAIHHPGELGAH